MILRFFIAALLCSSFHLPSRTYDYIQWNAMQRLSWIDFQAVPPQGATNAALTSSSILMRFSTNGKTLDFHISCQFDKQSSWGRVKNDHILSHEQGHFDIAEIHARKLNKELRAYKVNKSQVSRDVNSIYQHVMQELTRMQMQYDQETDYSRKFPEQKSWIVKIDSYLEGLKGFSNYR
ncbi:MAG: DUF922 domain-containing protein [Chitinophagaceae bacterium]